MRKLTQISILDLAVFAAAVAIALSVNQLGPKYGATAFVAGVWFLVVSFSGIHDWWVLIFHALVALVIFHAHFGDGYYSSGNEDAWLLPYTSLDVVFHCFTLSSLIVVIQSCFKFSKILPYHFLLGTVVLFPYLILSYPIVCSTIVGTVVLGFMRCWTQQAANENSQNQAINPSRRDSRAF